MILTPEEMAVIRSNGGTVTRLQANLLGGMSRRNVMIRKRDGREVWFSNDDTTKIKIEDGDEIELVPIATDLCCCGVCSRGRSHSFTGGLSRLARLGRGDEQDSPSD